MTQKRAKNREKWPFFNKKCHLKVTPEQNITLFFVKTAILIVCELRKAIGTLFANDFEEDGL